MEVIYSKYNYNRAPEYQTRTIICKDEEELHIEKSAITEAALEHIKSFDVKYDLIQGIYTHIDVLKADVKDGVVVYPYIIGKRIQEYIQEKVRSWDDLFLTLKELIDKLYVVRDKYVCLYEKSEEFCNIFGDVNCEGMVCVKPCNLDVIFDNIIICNDGSYKAYDYEWVCDATIPQKYVVYRVLCNFYDKYIGYIAPNYTFDEFINKFEFEENEKKIFRKMEDAFISHIYSNGNPVLNNNQFQKTRIDFNSLKSRYCDYDVVMGDYNRALGILHDTEKKYIVSIAELNKTAELYREECKKHQKTIDLYNQECNNHQAALDICANQKQNIDNLNEIIENLNGQIALMRGSISWKITKPIRGIKKTVGYVKDNGIKKTISRIVKKNKKNVLKGLFYDDYTVSKEEIERQKNDKINCDIKISVITPLFNTPKKYLIELLDSLMAQTYYNWELCIVNFGDDKHAYVDKICRKYARRDKRYNYHVAKKNNGISDNTNECISYATGNYIGLLDHDDILHPSALYEVAKRIDSTGADFLYTDEIKFEENINLAFAPNYKPDFSMYELYSHNYICHFNVYSRKLFDMVGGYRRKYDGSQDHDMVLRITCVANHIEHISKILYFWRVHEGSVALNIGEKPYATIAGERAVTEIIQKNDMDLYAESIINNIPSYRIKWRQQKEYSISVLIWGYGKDNLNNVGVPEIEKCEIIRVEKDEKGYKWKEAVEKASYDIILVLNDSIKKLCTKDILETTFYMMHDNVASMDAHVLDSTNHTISGGLYLSGDVAMPVKIRCMGGDKDYYGYENNLLYTREVTCSLGLCTFIKKSIWNKIYDDSIMNNEMAILYYSFLANENGYHNMWIPFIKVYSNDDDLSGKIVNSLLNVDNLSMPVTDAYTNKKIFEYKLE